MQSTPVIRSTWKKQIKGTQHELIQSYQLIGKGSHQDIQQKRKSHNVRQIQPQEIAADNLYDNSNDGIDSIQQDNLKILEQDEHEPTKKEDSPSPATKKTRKSTNAKGKQPAK